MDDEGVSDYVENLEEDDFVVMLPDGINVVVVMVGRR